MPEEKYRPPAIADGGPTSIGGKDPQAYFDELGKVHELHIDSDLVPTDEQPVREETES